MTENLFSNPAAVKAAAPLATRLRPRTLEEVVGQRHILAEGKLLWRAIKADRISSIILYGPPGTGKTSLAEVIANATQSKFERLSGVESNVADIRRVIASAVNRLANTGQKTILFIDEIHRFNKAQQDVLLPDVENGNVRLIGATTHNPFFYVNSPLVSRSQVFQLKSLTSAEIKTLLERGLKELKCRADEDALDFLATACDGDARKALNSLEIGALTTESGRITKAVAEESIQKKAVVYDGDQDEHYDTISAFIKSMRGSDPDAALYWLAKMVVAGEDPRFIARRICILAAEDIGLADPQALVLSVAAHHAVEFIGWPEGELVLAEATVYCATAPKSNASAKGVWSAKADVESGRTLAVPDHLKDTHYQGAARLGHGKGYKYAHDYEGHVVAQEHLPEKKKYYEPSDQGFEVRVKERMEKWKQLLKK
ncbi:MAG: putative AAA domain-containing protein [Verrucomicrobiae bacterium]|nr:putative AAA domain-containing protein [Verrucomicrobiae bacterium]